MGVVNKQIINSILTPPRMRSVVTVRCCLFQCNSGRDRRTRMLADITVSEPRASTQPIPYSSVTSLKYFKVVTGPISVRIHSGASNVCRSQCHWTVAH